MTNNKIERRSFAEVRASQGDEFAIVGYAALYNSESKNLGGFREKIAPGAFDRSLASGRDVQFTFNHSQDCVLARVANGTLQLSSDDRGLKFKAKLNRAIQQHRDLYEACRSGLYNECSFAFKVADGGEKWDGSVRTLTNVELVDCSLVGQPAYNGTSASARSGAIPTTAELKARAARLGVQAFASEDEQRRQKAEQLGKQIAAETTNQRSYEGDNKENLLDELQDLADERYGANRYRVIDCDGTCSKGTCVVRDMLSDTEDFYGIDYVFDDEGYERQLNPAEVSSMPQVHFGKRLRFTSNRRRVTPRGTRWEKCARSLAAAHEWFSKASERDMQQRIRSASRGF